MARRKCGLEGDPNYEAGMAGERAVQRSLQRMGYRTSRSECSLGAADIFAYHPDTGNTVLMQVKTTTVHGKMPTVSEAERKRLRKLAKETGSKGVVAFVRPGRHHRFEKA